MLNAAVLPAARKQAEMDKIRVEEKAQWETNKAIDDTK